MPDSQREGAASDYIDAVPKQLSLRKPLRVAAVVTVLGKEAHMDVLHVIAKAKDAGMRVRDVQEALACSRAHANTIIKTLEDAGLIKGDPPPHLRGGATTSTATVYRVDRAKVEKALDVLRKHLLAEK